MNEEIKRLKDYIDGAEKTVFFGGAGVSTESGIPDFRSVDGLYRQKYRFPPETIISREFFYKNPAEFFRFYFDKMIYTDARPNAAHLALARLERAGKLSAVVTQNIDGLHTAAGSKKVYELHGSVHRNHCSLCNKYMTLEEILSARDGEGIPRCECGGIVKPDVVLYGEALDDETVLGAVNAISACDLLIVGGTSLAVYPAAGLIRYRKNAPLIIVNRTPTPMSDEADLVVTGSIGEIFSAAVENPDKDLF